MDMFFSKLSSRWIYGGRNMVIKIQLIRIIHSLFHTHTHKFWLLLFNNCDVDNACVCALATSTSGDKHHKMRSAMNVDQSGVRYINKLLLPI